MPENPFLPSHPVFESAGSVEKRRNRRFSFRANVEIGWGSGVLVGTTRDISHGGMFIETPHALWLRAEFTARLHLQEPIELECVVRRVEPRRGMAVEFREIPEAEAGELENLLRALNHG